jgi:hypothetical protein
VRKRGAVASRDNRRASDVQADGRDEPAHDPTSQQLDFARWFADWWLRRGHRLAAEAQRHANG